MTVQETDQFLEHAEGMFYYNLLVLALETGMRIGELCGLTLEDVDFKDKLLHVRHTLCYFSKDGKYVFEIHDTKTDHGERTFEIHDTKTDHGERTIPLIHTIPSYFCYKSNSKRYAAKNSF